MFLNPTIFVSLLFRLLRPPADTEAYIWRAWNENTTPCRYWVHCVCELCSGVLVQASLLCSNPAQIVLGRAITSKTHSARCAKTRGVLRILYWEHSGNAMCTRRMNRKITGGGSGVLAQYFTPFLSSFFPSNIAQQALRVLSDLLYLPYV